MKRSRHPAWHSCRAHTKSQNNQFQEPAAILSPTLPTQVTMLHPHFTGPAPLPAICSGSFSPDKLSERQLVCLPPLRRDYLRQKEDGRCLATAGHLRNVMSVSLWTWQSPRPSSEETLLAPEGLRIWERGSREWGSGILNPRGIDWPHPPPLDIGSFAFFEIRFDSALSWGLLCLHCAQGTRVEFYFCNIPGPRESLAGQGLQSFL